MPVAATTHTYVITEVATSSGDGVTIVGSVDGVNVSVGVYQSQIDAANAQGGQPAVNNYIAAAMLAAANLPPANQGPAQPSLVSVGSFIQ